MNANGLALLSKTVNFIELAHARPDQSMMQHIKDGRATKIILDECRKDDVEFKNYFLKGPLGEIKYKVVTGKILDYKA